MFLISDLQKFFHTLFMFVVNVIFCLHSFLVASTNWLNIVVLNERLFNVIFFYNTRGNMQFFVGRMDNCW